MTSDQSEFWDRRYLDEGFIWGQEPSPTARMLTAYLPPGAQVLDVGFGYGRDLPFLIRRGYRTSGIDLSVAGLRLAEQLLARQGVQAEQLYVGRFEETHLPNAPFDGILSHRMAHLLVTRPAVERFVAKLVDVLRPGGMLFVAARNPRDLDPAAMVPIEEGVYEYRQRPGHRIRYWDEAFFHAVFDQSFDILTLTDAVENESVAQPVPCHFTVMIAQRKAGPTQRIAGLEGVPRQPGL
ncbi:MAG: methyltransferase domain-containing protein [Gemmataceae bacterium]|nr:methyltransferase domain-containing protein [Gemmataceae bacterium]MDW8263935.1 class I SAM-dependent methyltransferase [Gemmataceae bacterium]